MLEPHAALQLPGTIAEILRGDPKGIDVGSFLARFSGTQWVYLEGFNEFIAACVLDGGFEDLPHAARAVDGCSAEARSSIPEVWKREAPKERWRHCGSEQTGYARNCQPLCIDKALLLLVALAIACRRDAFPALRTLNPFAFITIHPAIYRLEGYQTWATLRGELHRRMTQAERELIASVPLKLQKAAPRDRKKATLERARSILDLAFRGRAMTWGNANLIASIFNEAAFNSPPGERGPGWDCLAKPMRPVVVDGRSDGGRFANEKHCNYFEGPFVTLGKADSLALTEAALQAGEAFKRSR